MAAALTQAAADAGGVELHTRSAGIHPGSATNPAAVEALRRRGITIEPKPSTRLSPELVARADLILCATERQRRKVAGADPRVADRIFVWGDFASRARQVSPT